MTHALTIDAASVRAELESPIVLSLSKKAPAPLMPKAADAVALTAAEHGVLRWVAAGRSNAQIGLCIGRSEKTVRNQLTRVYAKLGVANRAEAVAVHMRMEIRHGERNAN